MNVQFGKLVSKIQQAASPSERQEILESAAVKYSFTCHQLGMILMNLHYSSERKAAAKQLSLNVVDPENASDHLLPFLACESSEVREHILSSIINSTPPSTSHS